jgi:hypothetical protein
MPDSVPDDNSENAAPGSVPLPVIRLTLRLFAGHQQRTGHEYLHVLPHMLGSIRANFTVSRVKVTRTASTPYLFWHRVGSSLQICHSAFRVLSNG